MDKVSRSERGQAGFSLLEALVVLAIVAALATIGAGIVGSAMRRARLVSAARQIRSALWDGRMAAIRSGHNVVVSFDAAAGTLTIFEDYSADTALPHPPAEAANDGNGRRDTYGDPALDEPVLRTFPLTAHVVFRHPTGAAGDAASISFDGVVPGPGLAAVDDRVIFLPTGVSVPPGLNPAPQRSPRGAGYVDCRNNAKGIYLSDDTGRDFFRLSVDDFGQAGKVSMLKLVGGLDFGPAPWSWN
jgi:prepilin-type N-terminal cleavage/methylation domain-containing protein